MQVNLNLLPPELSVSKSLNNLLKTVRSLGVIFIVVFLITSIGLGIFLIVSKVTLDSLNAKVSTLKNQVTAQEKSEQQIMLLKDRLDKIVTIQNMPSSLTNLNPVQTLLNNLSVNTTVSQMQVDTSGASFSLQIKTNSDLSQFLTSVKNLNNFKTVGLTSFNLNPTAGYSLGVKMTN